MNSMLQTGLVILFTFLGTDQVFSQSQDTMSNQRPLCKCSSNEKPYRDFDFLVGHWDFFSTEGNKIGEQVYIKREQGCLIVEEWTTVSGGTGLGMSFVDPKNGLWRQVWMSPMYHIDYSGGLNESGAMVLEGTMYPNNGEASSQVRGIWTKQADGSVKQEFLILNTKTNTWAPFFVGFSRPK